MFSGDISSAIAAAIIDYQVLDDGHSGQPARQSLESDRQRVGFVVTWNLDDQFH
jgi:hypothetical protein